MIERRRFNQTKTFEERFAEEAVRFREAAEGLPQGAARELLMQRARQTEAACHVSEWLQSPGLQPPR